MPKYISKFDYICSDAFQTKLKQFNINKMIEVKVTC